MIDALGMIKEIEELEEKLRVAVEALAGFEFSYRRSFKKLNEPNLEKAYFHCNSTLEKLRKVIGD